MVRGTRFSHGVFERRCWILQKKGAIDVNFVAVTKFAQLLKRASSIGTTRYACDWRFISAEWPSWNKHSMGTQMRTIESMLQSTKTVLSSALVFLTVKEVPLLLQYGRPVIKPHYVPVESRTWISSLIQTRNSDRDCAPTVANVRVSGTTTWEDPTSFDIVMFEQSSLSVLLQVCATTICWCDTVERNG